MLSDRQLARVRARHVSWLVQHASIKRPATTQTPDGFPVASMQTIATLVPCRIDHDSTRGREPLTEGGVIAASDVSIQLPHDVVAILEQDRIDVLGVGVFEVRSVQAARGVRTHVTARCVLVDGGSA